MRRHAAHLLLAGFLAAAPAAARPAAEGRLLAAWVGRQVVLRTVVLSNCDERYTDNRMRGGLPSSAGAHRFAPGEAGRIDNLTLQRARIDLLVTLIEPLRVELRDGPFRLFEQVGCRVELEIPAPRDAVRQGDTDRLDGLIRGVLEGQADSPLWNRRRVEPLPDDHEERLAAYRAWKEEQLYLALRDRLAEALERAAEIAARADRGVAYARGLVLGAREFDPERLFSTACGELPGARFASNWRQPPEELEGQDKREWKDGFEDGRRLRFELVLARRLERCLP